MAPHPFATLLPPNSTPLERAFERLIHRRIAAIETAYRQYWSADDCPEAQLPWLAWALSVDEWDPAWPVAVRRAQVARAIALQRRKGTLAAVRAVIGAFGGTVGLREWWQVSPPAAPHTFDLVVALAGIASPDANYIDGIIRAVHGAKPLRSHFTFTVARSFSGGIGTRGVGRAAIYARAGAIAPAHPAPPTALTLGGDPLTLGGDFLTLGT